MDQEQRSLDRKTTVFLKRMRLFLTSVLLLELASIAGLCVLYILTHNLFFLLGLVPLGFIEGIATYYLLVVGANRIAKWYFHRKE